MRWPKICSRPASVARRLANSRRWAVSAGSMTAGSKPSSASREHNRIRPRLLREQPRLGRHKMDKALPQLLELGACPDVLEADQDLTRLHLIAFAHVDLADDPAFQMLDRLAAAVRAHHARRDRRTGEGRYRRPGAEPTEEHQDRPIAHKLGPAHHACQRQRYPLAVGQTTAAPLACLEQQTAHHEQQPPGPARRSQSLMPRERQAEPGRPGQRLVDQHVHRFSAPLRLQATSPTSHDVRPASPPRAALATDA